MRYVGFEPKITRELLSLLCTALSKATNLALYSVVGSYIIGMNLYEEILAFVFLCK